MVKVAICRSVEARVEYFLGDRELGDDEKTGEWMGYGARVLGLRVEPTVENPAPARRPVTEEDLRTVLSGYTPRSVALECGWRLNGRYYPEGKRRCAYEFVFSGDKSVSIAALCLPDQYLGHAMAVRQAWVQAIGNALTFMETLARRAGGRGIDIATNSLLVAGFNHFTSRHNDPQLHTHLLAANATFDTSGEGSKMWYSLEPVQLFKAIVPIDMVFQRELVRHLRALGLEAYLKKVDNRVVAALPAVDEGVCRRLSKAHAAILRATEDRWERDERTLRDLREEDRFNDRTRPSKTGLLAARTEAFERALSAREIEGIVQRMGTPLSLEERRLAVSKRPPSLQAMDRLIIDAATHLDIGAPTLKETILTALVASKSRMDVPFALFHRHAVERTAILRTEASTNEYFQKCLDARDRFWREEYDLYGVGDLRTPIPLACATHGPELSSSDSPPTFPVHPSAAPGHSSLPAHGADPSPTWTRKRLESSPASAPDPGLAPAGPMPEPSTRALAPSESLPAESGVEPYLPLGEEPRSPGLRGP